MQNFDVTVFACSFRFLSSPFPLLFLPHFCLFAGHLVGISVETVFGKAFRILGLDERKGFLREFSGQCYIDGFLPITLAALTELCSF